MEEDLVGHDRHSGDPKHLFVRTKSSDVEKGSRSIFTTKQLTGRGMMAARVLATGSFLGSFVLAGLLAIFVIQQV